MNPIHYVNYPVYTDYARTRLQSEDCFDHGIRINTGLITEFG